MPLTAALQPEEVEDLDIDFESQVEIDEEDVKEITKNISEAQYFDASSMAPLTPSSVVSIPDLVKEERGKILTRTKAAIARLRAYKPPPFSTWDRLPLSRRAAVLILLFADRRGDLRVVLTMRAATLRNYSGDFTTQVVWKLY